MLLYILNDVSWSYLHAIVICHCWFSVCCINSHENYKMNEWAAVIIFTVSVTKAQKIIIVIVDTSCILDPIITVW